MFKDCLIVLVSLVLVLGSYAVQAQSNLQKLDVGGQFTTLRLKEPIPRASNLCLGPIGPQFSTNIAGFGGRASYKLTSKFALDAEVNYFPVKPREHFFQSDPRWQGLVGVKAGTRKKRFAVFGKARPGFLRLNGLSRITSVDRQFMSPFGCVSELISFTDEKKSVLNLDLGGTVEVYLPKRIYLRVDVGDTVIRYPRRVPTQFNPAFTTHNLQFSAGIGFRF
jgi:hypothetical protein